MPTLKRKKDGKEVKLVPKPKTKHKKRAYV